MALGWLKDKLSDIGDAAWDAATDIADAAVDAVGTAAAATGDVIGAVGNTVDTATFGAASGILDIVDDTVLDAVDTATGGLIDIDFDDGNLSASVGVDGFVHVGAAVGEDGVRHSADFVDQGFDIGLTQDGLEASGHAGVDWGPLPYAEADLTIGADGDVAFDGRAQGTVPTPIGLLSGQADASFVRDGDQWGGQLDADGTLRRPDGSIVRGGVDVAYVETDDGSMLSVGVEGSYTQPGTGTVGGSFGYDRLEADGVVAEKFDAEAYASGFGVKVEAGVSGTSVTTADGTISEWDATADVTGLGFGGQAPADAPVAAVSPDQSPVPQLAESVSPIDVEMSVPVPDVAPVEAAWQEPFDAAVAEPVMAYEAPTPAAEPATHFESSIAAADDVEGSVDEMFGDLG